MLQIRSACGCSHSFRFCTGVGFGVRYVVLRNQLRVLPIRKVKVCPYATATILSIQLAMLEVIVRAKLLLLKYVCTFTPFLVLKSTSNWSPTLGLQGSLMRFKHNCRSRANSKRSSFRSKLTGPQILVFSTPSACPHSRTFT